MREGIVEEVYQLNKARKRRKTPPQVQTRICIACQVEKPRILAGRNRYDTAWIYHDDRGRPWRSKHCPDCLNDVYRRQRNREKQMEQMRTGTLEETPQQVIVRPKKVKRFCRNCKKVLPPNRYFRHDFCTPNIHDLSSIYAVPSFL